MKIVFAGTPEFAATALDALVKAGHQVELVLTQPDRPAGRGMKLQPSAVKKLALANGIPVLQPVSLRIDGKSGEEAQQVYDRIQAINPDVMVVVAYGLILPKEFLVLPANGCLNIHASLLPRWRGAAPIQRAIEAGDAESGVAIMRMEEGLDTGPVLMMASTPITEKDTAAVLHDRLAGMGGRLIVQALQKIADGTATYTPQDDSLAVYARKLHREEAALDFSLSAQENAAKIRAFNPFPGCTAEYGDVTLKIWDAQLEEADSSHPAGKILSADGSGIVVACGKGSLRILMLQKPGAKRLPASEFIKGFSFTDGQLK
ncbi:MAG: methionyl-tRNA formyltransferase [Oxalobacter sp.]|nr:methionyl-tRNA formyltransferase [Oxalobacter sp.]